MAKLLEQLALDKVQRGDEAGARDALKEKASVTEAMEKNSTKVSQRGLAVWEAAGVLGGDELFGACCTCKVQPEQAPRLHHRSAVAVAE